MFIRVLSRRSLANILLPLTAITVAGLLLAYPQAVSTGISRGLSVCTTVIIPTLYPFMLLAGWLADSPLCRQPPQWLCRITRGLFGLPGCCGPAILLSLVGGYPAGALAIARLQQQGLLDKSQVQRMTAYCVGGGPGFVISTVGSGLLRSTGAGVCLYAAQTSVSLVVGIWLGRGHRREDTRTPPPSAPPRSITRLVADTCASLLTMSGFVTLAATLLSLWEGMGLSLALQKGLGVPAASISATLAAVLEVSCGCIALAGRSELTPLWLSLCLSWGGLSVQGQFAAALPGQRVLTSYFYTWRMLHGLLSGGLSLLLFRLFPLARFTGTGAPTPIPFSVSATASAMLLLLSFLAMLCFSSKSTGKTERDVVYWKKSSHTR